MSDTKHEEKSILAMEIEQYNNGIAIKQVDGEGNIGQVVCYNHDINNTSGKEVWAEATSLMNLVVTNLVKIRMEFITNEGE